MASKKKQAPKPKQERKSWIRRNEARKAKQEQHAKQVADAKTADAIIAVVEG